MNDTIVIAGSLAQKPQHGGHTWVFLQYLLGLRRLGWDVLFLDQLAEAMCVDADGRPTSFEHSLNLRHLREVMTRFGLQHSYAVLFNGGEQTGGLSRQQVLERTRRSALLVNVMGFLDDEEILGCAPQRVFLDIDPGFGQMWQELGLRKLFHGYDRYVTVGENIGQQECAIPTCGINWITTRPPVVLDHWLPHAPDADGPFTSVASWRGAYGPLEYRGTTYGLRVHEFRRFVELPWRSGQPLQLALDIHPAEERDLALLKHNGWSLVDPKTVVGDPWAYQSYIHGSRGEIMVAKQMYVQSRSGWFSDRSVCYLASGRPVLAQDTGWSQRYPTGEGLLAFTTIDEALAGLQTLAADNGRHRRAARALAEAYFDSDKVLGQLLATLGVG